MRKVILFTACSLDGYIAGLNGEIDWLFHDQDYGYGEFYQSVDTILCGNNTYKTIQNPEIFPYRDKKNYIFSRKPPLHEPNPAEYISAGVPEFVRSLKTAPGNNIFLVGGGQINSLLLNNHLIEEMILSVHPVILGSGIPLFHPPVTQTSLRFKSAVNYETGLVQIKYEISRGRSGNS